MGTEVKRRRAQRQRRADWISLLICVQRARQRRRRRLDEWSARCIQRPLMLLPLLLLRGCADELPPVLQEVRATGRRTAQARCAASAAAAAAPRLRRRPRTHTLLGTDLKKRIRVARRGRLWLAIGLPGWPTGRMRRLPGLPPGPAGRFLSSAADNCCCRRGGALDPARRRRARARARRSLAA